MRTHHAWNEVGLAFLYSTIERPIRSIQQLRQLMKKLEEDQALRIEGNVPEFNGGFIFVGLFGGKYQVNLCEKIHRKKVKSYTVGTKNEWYEFQNFDQTWSFLRPLFKRPIQAWIY